MSVLSAALDELEWKSLARKRLETFEEEIHAGNFSKKQKQKILEINLFVYLMFVNKCRGSE